MKIPGGWRKHLVERKMVFFLMVLVLFACSGIAFASGGAEGAVKTWEETDTWRVMNFAILAVALFFLLRKPASMALNGRIAEIKDQLSELEKKKNKAEKELTTYKMKLQSLDRESEQIVEEYVRQGNEAKARILKEAGSAAGKIGEQAKRNIEHEFKRAKSMLQEEVLEKALQKAEEIVKKSITVEDQDRIVDEYLDKVA